jgi:hypothetical protein
MKNIFLLFAISLVSIFTFAQCPEGQLEVDLEIATDNWEMPVAMGPLALEEMLT